MRDLRSKSPIGRVPALERHEIIAPRQQPAHSRDLQPTDIAQQAVAESIPWSVDGRDAVSMARTIGFGASGDHDAVCALPDLAQQLELSGSTLDNLAAMVDQQVEEMSDLMD